MLFVENLFFKYFQINQANYFLEANAMITLTIDNYLYYNLCSIKYSILPHV